MIPVFKVWIGDALPLLGWNVILAPINIDIINAAVNIIMVLLPASKYKNYISISIISVLQRPVNHEMFRGMLIWRISRIVSEYNILKMGSVHVKCM